MSHVPEKSPSLHVNDNIYIYKNKRNDAFNDLRSSKVAELFDLPQGEGCGITALSVQFTKDKESSINLPRSNTKLSIVPRARMAVCNA
jgi:hypothetical protein